MHCIPGRQLPVQLYLLIQAHPSIGCIYHRAPNGGSKVSHATWGDRFPPGITAGYATMASEYSEDADDPGGNTHGRHPPPLKNPFPYPTNTQPTPHQIFHLPFGASQAQIKARYYELVRAHHPDSPHACHLPSALAHARFRQVKGAYDFLRGKTMSPHPNARPAPSPKNFDPYMHELSRRRRAYYASHGGSGMGEDDAFGSERWAKPGWGEGFGAPKNARSDWKEDGWRERVILTLGVITLIAGLFPTMPSTIVSAFMPTPTTPSHLPDSPSSSTPNPSYNNTAASPSSPSTPNAPSSPSSTDRPSPASNTSPAPPASFPFNLIPDLDKGHRTAVAALVQCRHERQKVGAERREGVRQRVKEINEGGSETNAPTEERLCVDEANPLANAPTIADK